MKIEYKLVIYCADGVVDNDKLCADVRPAVDLQRSLGCRIAYVSSDKPEIVNAQLEALNCAGLFDKMICDAKPRKTEALKKLCTEVSVLPQEACCISNFLSDLNQAYDAGVIPIGIQRNDPELGEVQYAAHAARVLTDMRDLIFHLPPSIVSNLI